MSLVQGSNGFLYGTTPQGGTGQTGTVFAMSLEGKLKTLVTFNGTDGNDAYYGLTLFKGIFSAPHPMVAPTAMAPCFR